MNFTLPATGYTFVSVPPSAYTSLTEDPLVDAPRHKWVAGVITLRSPGAILQDRAVTTRERVFPQLEAARSSLKELTALSVIYSGQTTATAIINARLANVRNQIVNLASLAGLPATTATTQP